MKILFWQCDKTDKDACKWVYKEAKEQGYDVEMAGYRGRPREFLAKLDEYKPDWVFSYVVHPTSIPIYQIIKSKGVKLAVSYHDQVCEPRKDLFRRMTGCFDLAIFSIKDALNAYGDCAKQCHFLPQYFAQNFCELKWKRLDQTKPIYDIVVLSFILDSLRRSYIRHLESKYKVLYASNLIGSDMTEAYAQAKIAVGLPRDGFTGLPGEYVTSNRIYNAMGSGAFYLSHNINNVELFFEPKVHMDMVKDDTFEEFDEKIQYYLENENERERIAYTGQQEILKNHTLKTRVREYISLLENFKE